ncbi:MAG: hypothetical protein R6U27_16895 [Desulfobacterales bacterium]
MKIRWVLLAVTICFMMIQNVNAQVPYEIAGFALGKNIKDYQDKLRMDTVLPIRYAEFLKEVEIRNIPGYKSGLITYGDCAVPGRILRIKLKYEDYSRKFYNNLLDRFKKRFGKPDRWRGDPFHVVVAWKWSFTDTNGNRISLILQHNVEDTTRKLGNAVKMSILNFEEEEIQCFEKIHPDKQDFENGQDPESQDHPDWDFFIPR